MDQDHFLACKTQEDVRGHHRRKLHQHKYSTSTNIVEHSQTWLACLCAVVVRPDWLQQHHSSRQQDYFTAEVVWRLLRCWQQQIKTL